MASPPPGWYDDPARSGRLRYWDGAGWTEHLSDPAPAQPPSERGVESTHAASAQQATAGHGHAAEEFHGASAARPHDAAVDDTAPGQAQNSAGRDDSGAFWPFTDHEAAPTRPLQQVPPAPTHDGSGTSAPQAAAADAARQAAAGPEEAKHTSPIGPDHGQRPDAHQPAPPSLQARQQHPQQQQSQPWGRPPQPQATSGARAADGTPLAPWWRRLLAWALDAAVVIAVSILPASFILATRIDQLEVYTRSVEAAAGGGGSLPAVPEGLAGAVAACMVVTALLYFLYEVFGLSHFGATLGRRVLGLRVRVPGTPGNLPFEAASRRAGVKVAGQLAGGVPVLATLGLFFTIGDLARGAMDRERRTVHDLAGGTEVVMAAPAARPQGSPPHPPGAAQHEHRSA